ncbi:MAG TPA: amidohydrolase, partial [Butyricimonas virosa]|nr:amidohydrolase [Butyricimonas virosa]
FGLFTQQYKGAMFGLGSGENCPPLHSPQYDFPDEVIETGATLFYTIAEANQ